MKYLMMLLSLCAATALHAQHTLKQLWQTDSIVAVPESVLFDAVTNKLYVSLIDGEPWGADGKGGIARMNPDGNGYEAEWVVGLNAPKGMAIHKGKLYVADLNEVAVIDVPTGKVEKKIAVEGASGLNDVTVSRKGVVYVSDSKTAKIHKIRKGVPTVYLENMQGVNGLKAVGKDLIIASGKRFTKANKKGALTDIGELAEGGDGIEPVGNGDYLVSAWTGLIWYVTPDGKSQTLLDTREQKTQTADIGYDPAKRIVYVPTFFGKRVVAYQLD